MTKKNEQVKRESRHKNRNNALYMATISRFIKCTVPKLARHKFSIYDSSLHCRVFRPYDRKLSSKVFEDDDNEVVTNAGPKLFGTKPKSTELNDNFSSEISSKKSSKILPFRLKEHEKWSESTKKHNLTIPEKLNLSIKDDPSGFLGSWAFKKLEMLIDNNNFGLGLFWLLKI
uniref:Uncharacterized protein n=1 Tax=Romanomermis culicivorax TaxID=13658 RepID=A0A915KQ95_ROMCU